MRQISSSVLLTFRGIRCDTNLKRNILMRKDSKVTGTFWNDVPRELLKTLEVEACVGDEWVTCGTVDGNRTRLIKVAFECLEVTAIRIRLKETYGHPNAKLFEVRCYADR